MSRVAYVNGRYMPHAQAGVSIDDRGFQFADGVYEVVEVHAGALIDEDLHLERLRRSLAELRIGWPLGELALRLVAREVIRRNRVRDGMVYIQVSRGVAMREHVFPDPLPKPGLVVTARSIDAVKGDAKAAVGIRVITLPDIRWKRPDIKSTSLLPNVLAKQAAKEQSAGEAWLIGPDGLITEGAATNAWIIDTQGHVITRPADRAILKGITRTTLFRLITDRGFIIEERAFSPTEAYAAREAFVTGATTLVMPVIAIDSTPIGDGRPGPIVMDLRSAFHGAAQHSGS